MGTGSAGTHTHTLTHNRFDGQGQYREGVLGCTLFLSLFFFCLGFDTSLGTGVSGLAFSLLLFFSFLFLFNVLSCYQRLSFPLFLFAVYLSHRVLFLRLSELILLHSWKTTGTEAACDGPIHNVSTRKERPFLQLACGRGTHTEPPLEVFSQAYNCPSMPHEGAFPHMEISSCCLCLNIGCTLMCPGCALSIQQQGFTLGRQTGVASTVGNQ